jgi:hypothetical protein
VNHDNAFSATSLPGNLPRLQKGGYWLGGSGDGYGYPLGGMGYPQPIAADDNRTITNDQARPGPAKGYGYFQRRPAYSPNRVSKCWRQPWASTRGVPQSFKIAERGPSVSQFGKSPKSLRQCR